MIVEQALEKIDIFSLLDQEELQKLASFTTIKTFNQDNIIFYEGEIAEYFYGLVEGSVKLYKTGLKNNEVVLHYFTQPSLVAEIVSLEDTKFPATAVAMSKDTKVAFIKKNELKQMLQNDSRFSFHIIKSLTKKIKNLEQVINHNLVFDSLTKVSHFIKQNPEFLVNNTNIHTANMINMAPETLSRILAKLRKVGVLDKQNKVIDYDKLELFLEF